MSIYIDEAPARLPRPPIEVQAYRKEDVEALLRQPVPKTTYTIAECADMAIAEGMANALAASKGSGAPRKPISARTRFHVLKRDGFACQYCGGRAPEVALECDHIQPIADGGPNTKLNLVAACRACNGGKSGTPLPDALVLEMQKGAFDREVALLGDGHE